MEGLVRQLYSTVDVKKQDELWRELGDYPFPSTARSRSSGSRPRR